MMKYKDKVYGQITIKEKVIVELIKTNAMQRLKGVNQGGVLIFLNPNHGWRKFKTTRFEHSVGVCIVLKKFNACLEEQIAGLLHDVSHTTFSHALDFMFNRHTQHDYHEQFHEKMILDSKIPLILKKHDIEVNNILDEKRFTLLERELPDLCADRVDYDG
jgi:HD superfamily phosphohydrolase